jgi:hypothetical protein
MTYLKKLRAVALALLFCLASLPAAAQTCTALGRSMALCYGLPPAPTPTLGSDPRLIILNWESDYSRRRVGSPRDFLIRVDSPSIYTPSYLGPSVLNECEFVPKQSRVRPSQTPRSGRRR